MCVCVHEVIAGFNGYDESAKQSEIKEGKQKTDERRISLHSEQANASQFMGRAHES